MQLHLVSIPEEQDNMETALHKCLVTGMPWAHVQTYAMPVDDCLQ